jgi:hypothetical protein
MQMKRFNWLSLLVLVCLLVGLTSNALAVFPTSAVICDQAKVEILQGHIKSSDSFHFILKVAANSTTDATNSTTTSCTVGSYNTTGELATLATTGYTQGGITKTDCTATLSTHSVNFTCGASTWTAVSAAATFDAIEVYDATCTGCANSNQLVAIFPITSFTGPTAGTYTVTPPANMFVLTYNEYGLPQWQVASLAIGGEGKIQLPAIDLTGSGRI